MNPNDTTNAAMAAEENQRCGRAINKGNRLEIPRRLYQMPALMTSSIARPRRWVQCGRDSVGGMPPKIDQAAHMHLLTSQTLHVGLKLQR